MRFLLLFALTLCATKPQVVAVVGGRPIPRSEVQSSNATSVSAEEKERLRQKLWCEVARAYVDAHHLAQSANELKAYTARTKKDLPLCTTRGLRDPAAEFATTILDGIAYEKHGGRRLQLGSQLVPVDAREAMLIEAQRDGTVQIVDAAYADVIAAYTMREMNSPDQVRIDCANGFSFVVRRREDGAWYEERKVQAGAQQAYKSVTDAASQRCVKQ